MGAGKRWKDTECVAAARAYIEATHDPVSGSEQNKADFAYKIQAAFKRYSPAGCGSTGTYWDRDPDGTQAICWNYIRDTILKQCQQFNGVLNTVLNMQLSGPTYEQKVSIAVATFLKKIKPEESPIEYIEFDKMKWRLYNAWLLLKDTDKCSPPTQARHPTDQLHAELDAVASDNENDENLNPVTPASRVSGAQLNSTTKGVFTGVGRQGRDAAKRHEAKDALMRKRTALFDNISKSEDKKIKTIEGLELQIKAQNMIAMLGHYQATNPAMASRLEQRILETFGEEPQEQETINSDEQEEPSSDEQEDPAGNADEEQSEAGSDN